MTICVTFNDEAIKVNSKPKRYPVRDLFVLPESNETVDFEELGRLPRSYFSKVKEAEIFKTYPQNIPMKEIVTNITNGIPVSYVSFVRY